jgi:carnitine O-acetyltransferase
MALFATTSSAALQRTNTSGLRTAATLSPARVLSSVTPPVFVPWKTPKVEAHGDYLEEAWLEKHIGGPLYQYQADLPLLPVVSVAQTLERFLPTALPLARTAEEAANLKSAVARFPDQARKLQERLTERRRQNDNSSWLQQWWNQAGYLQVRDPVVINVSYFFHLKDDPAALVAGAGADAQIRRAAALLVATAEYRKAVCSGQLPADVVGKNKTPLCSAAYKYMFHATRIPARHQDSYTLYDPAVYHHAVVCSQGQFFAMDFVDAVTGNPFPLAVLQAGLEECRSRAATNKEQQPLLGWLTSQNRDDWADSRQALLAATGGEAALELLQSGALLICLDGDNDTPVSRQECAQLFLHAGRDASAGANRWFDKSIQLVVTHNGKAGLLGEHAMMDGMPVVGFANRLTELTYAVAAANEQRLSSSSARTNVVSCNVRPIFTGAFQELTNNASDIAMVSRLVIKGTCRKLLLAGLLCALIKPSA